MRTIVYSKPNCPRCAKAKHALTQHNITFSELVIGEHVDRELVLQMFPGVKQLPIISRDGVPTLLEEIIPPGPQLLTE